MARATLGILAAGFRLRLLMDSAKSVAELMQMFIFATIAKARVYWYDVGMAIKKLKVIRIIKKGNKGGGIQHSTQIKKATGGKPVNIRKGEWELAKLEDTRGMSKEGRGNKKMSEELKLEMAKDKAAGMTNKELSEKYCVAENLVASALNQIYLNNKVARELLKKVMLKTAVAAAANTMSRVDELDPARSAVVAGIMTSKVIDLERHEANQPREIDVDRLGEVADILSGLDQIAAGAPDGASILDDDPE